MGDRANVMVLQSNDPPVVIYSHWGGTALAGGFFEDMCERSRDRIGDPHYFTAMLITEMVKAEILSGVGTSLDDNEHDIMVVDAMTGKRTLIHESEAQEMLRR